MKNIAKLSLVALISLTLSACTLKDQLKSQFLNKIDQTKTAIDDKLGEKIAAERAELDTEATSSSDKALLKSFDQDKDQNFSSEFNQLNTDLQ